MADDPLQIISHLEVLCGAYPVNQPHYCPACDKPHGCNNRLRADALPAALEALRRAIDIGHPNPVGLTHILEPLTGDDES